MAKILEMTREQVRFSVAIHQTAVVTVDLVMELAANLILRKERLVELVADLLRLRNLNWLAVFFVVAPVKTLDDFVKIKRHWQFC